MVAISQAWYNGPYTLAAYNFHSTMIQFLIFRFVLNFCASCFELILYYSKLPVFYFFIQRLLANTASDVSSVRFVILITACARHLACTYIHSNKLRSLKCALLRSFYIHLFNFISGYISLFSLSKDYQKREPDVVLILALSSPGVVKCKISRKAFHFQQLYVDVWILK